MNKITRLLATAALLFGVLGGVSSVKAGKVYASFSVATGCTWDAGTNTMEFTEVGGWQILLTGLPSGDITSYTKFHATLSSMSDNITNVRLRIKDTGDKYADVNLVEGENNIDLAALATANPNCVFTQIKDITIWSPTSAAEGKTVDVDNPASVVITNAYLMKTEDVATCTGFGDEITSLAGITDGTSFVISDGTKVKYFYTNNESENANKESVPHDSYYYFTLEKYTDGDIGNAYRIKITNANGEGYPRGSDGTSNYYLNAVLGYADVVISGTKDGWGGNKKDALWYVTYDNEKGFSFQNVYRADNGGKSWLAIGNDFVDDKQYLKLYKSLSFDVNTELDATGLDFNEFGIATTDKRCLRAEGGLSYNTSTGVLTSNGEEGKMTLEFDNPVDLKNLFQFNLAQSGSTGDILSRLEFYDEDNALINTWNGLKLGNKGWPTGIDDAATNAFLNHKPVKKMVWPSDAKTENNGKTATITSVEFICKTIACAKAGETVLKSLPYQNMDGTTATPTWNVNTSTDTYYGTGEGTNAVSYTDITEYSELRIYRNDNTGFRAFFINAAGTKVNTINHENAASSWNAEGKYWSIDLSKVEKYNEKVALQSIKSAGWGQNNIVNNIVVYKTPAANAPQYILTGSGMQLAETVAALADASATCIDATGVTGITTNSEAGRTLLTSANPNCIFLGTTGNGHLANTQNVVTSGTCANLVLTDNYPFQAPEDFTATAASYSTTINATAQCGTLCLPFAAAIPDGVTAYTLNYTSGDAATATPVDATIPANTPVLLNGNDEKTFTGATVEIDADATNVSGALTGVFQQGYVPVNSYILQNQSSGIGFYKVATANTNVIKPFRAYLTVEGEGPSRLSIDFIENDEPTGVGAALMNNEVMNNEVYNLCGQRVEKATKGLYIKNGKKVIMK